MKDSIVIFGKDIPTYGICFYLGVLLSVCVGLFLIKKRKIELFDFVCCSVYVMIGAIVGAKLLFILVSIKDIIKYDLGIVEIIKGGFVFYGGLLGGVAGVFIYTKQFKLNTGEYFDVYATVLPLGHAVGRVGCFFAGCCYGMEYNGFGAHVYEESLNIFTPIGVPLLPIQLIEAICLLCLFFCLLKLFYRVKNMNGKVALTYAFSYALLRFILEFFRGDVERGVFFVLSTSQWISLLVGIAAILFLHKRRKRDGCGK